MRSFAGWWLVGAVLVVFLGVGEARGEESAALRGEETFGAVLEPLAPEDFFGTTPYDPGERWNQSFGVWAAAGAWFTRADGTVQSSTPEVPGTRVGLRKTAELEKDKIAGAVNLGLILGGRHVLRVSGFGVSREGQTILTEGVTFAGNYFEPSSYVDSELDYFSGRVSYEYLLDAGRWGLVTVGLGGQVDHIAIEVRTVGGQDVSRSTIVLPIVGTTWRYVLHRAPDHVVAFGLRAWGMHDGAGYVFDGEASLDWLVSEALEVRGGWRYMESGFDDEDFDATYRMDGLFLELSVFF